MRDAIGLRGAGGAAMLRRDEAGILHQANGDEGEAGMRGGCAGMADCGDVMPGCED